MTYLSARQKAIHQVVQDFSAREFSTLITKIMAQQPPIALELELFVSELLAALSAEQLSDLHPELSGGSGSTTTIV